MAEEKLSAKALIIRNGKILLLKPKEGPGLFGWDGPGGHVQSGEGLIDTLKREVLEETGLRLKEAIPLKVLKLPRGTTNYLIFLATVTEGDVILSEEHTSFRWVTPKFLRETMGIDLVEELKKVKSLTNKAIGELETGN